MSNYISERENIVKLFNDKLYKTDFKALALAIFRFQYLYNKTYKQFCDLLKIDINKIFTLEQIPFLPISLFKNHIVKTGNWKEETIFGSSGTSGTSRSKHFIRDEKFYINNTRAGFEDIYGLVENYCFVAILPGYSERPDSSLISMVDEFIKSSKYIKSGYYLNREEEMIKVLGQCKKDNIPTILFGVSFALLELCRYNIEFSDLIVIETGGMKTAKIEMTKEEIIDKFKIAWNIKSINSEYGMTELLSQSYSLDGKWYKTTSTKKVLIGELRDPLQFEKLNKVGVIKIIDCANFDTCSFLETQDLGMLNDSQDFQVLGRMDDAELRGCNLLLDETLENPIS